MKVKTRSTHQPNRPNYWHARRLEDVYRLQRFVSNELATDNPNPKLPLLIRQFTNPLVYILVIGGDLVFVGRGRGVPKIKPEPEIRR